MAPRVQRREDMVNMYPLEKTTPKYLYKLSKIFYYNFIIKSLDKSIKQHLTNSRYLERERNNSKYDGW